MKVNKANTIAGLICRTFSYLDGPPFKKLFTTFVRPHLEYGQLIWTPHLKKYITILKNVQRRAAKLVDGFHHMSFSERLKKLDLPSLVYRRARDDNIEIFKHFHSYNNCTLPENFRPRNCLNRKHEYQLVWRAPKDGVRKLQETFFYLRTIKTWNKFSNEIAYAKSINLFINKLDEAWKDLPVNFYEQERFIEAQICLQICNFWIIIIIIIIIFKTPQWWCNQIEVYKKRNSEWASYLLSTGSPCAFKLQTIRDLLSKMLPMWNFKERRPNL